MSDLIGPDRALLFWDQVAWVAIGAEYDAIAQGPDPETALQRLDAVVKVYRALQRLDAVVKVYKALQRLDAVVKVYKALEAGGVPVSEEDE